uniref:Uncharacterized protein n=1 Tax=Anguilla anguilla TaxID=7936 RepID=A0A0E9SYS7_ANGAN
MSAISDILHFCAPPSHQNQLYVHIQGVWHPTPLLSCHWESDLG